jgi:flagellar basal-body rod modification protein FlgD
MSAIEASGVSGVGAGVGGDLGGAQFLQLLVAQLKNQDPLKPQDNAQFVSELAQFTALQTEQTNGETQNKLLAQTSALRAEGLLGRTVNYKQDGEEASGKVTGEMLVGSAIDLLLDSGAKVDLASVQSTQ